MRVKSKTIALFTIYLIGILVPSTIWILNYDYFNPMLLICILSFVFFGFSIINEYVNTKSLFNIMTFFNAFGLTYTNYYIYEMVIKNRMISSVNYWTMMISYFAIISCNIGFRISRKRNIRFFKQSRNGYYKYEYNMYALRLFSTVLFLVSILVEAYLISRVFGTSVFLSLSRGERTLQMSGYGILAFYKSTIPLTGCIFFYNYIKEHKKYDFIFFLLAMSVAMFNAISTGSRTEFISVVIPVVFLLNLFNKINNRKIIIIFIALVILMGVWKSLYSVNRSFSLDSEFNTWYRVTETVINSDHKYYYGKTYLDTIINLVIPITNTEALSDWYVRTYEYDAYLRGLGRGFPGVLEAYLNFWYFGIPLVYGFYGFILKQLDTDSDLDIIIYIIFLLSMHKFFRSESYSLWKNMMWLCIYPTVIIYWLSKKNSPNLAEKMECN